MSRVSPDGYWYYRGMAGLLCALYALLPKNGAVIVVGLNSQPDAKQNHDGTLLEEVYGICTTRGRCKQQCSADEQRIPAAIVIRVASHRTRY